MLEHTERYINRCIEIGILTEDKIHKYPLRNANLAMVLKAYAVYTNKPYSISQAFHVFDDHTLYLTEGGFEWLFSVFGFHSLEYLRSTFQFVFANAAPEDVHDPDYIGYNNFKGITGDKPKAGSRQKALLIHKGKEYKFDTLREARDELFQLCRFYPVDEFTLYRIRKQTKKGKVSYYKEKVPTTFKQSKRGMNNNLPTRRS